MRWLLAITALEMVKSGDEKATEEPEVDILSSNIAMNKFSFYNEESDVQNETFAILHSSDCSRPLAAKKPSLYYVYVVGVAWNTTTGHFEWCESPPNVRRIKIYRKDKKYRNCTDVESGWMTKFGCYLPLRCTFFFVVNTWSRERTITQYRDAQMSVDHGKPLLIFKPSIEGGLKGLKSQQIPLKLIENTIIGKKIPTLFWTHFKIRTTPSPTVSTTTKPEATDTTQGVSTTQIYQKNSTAHVTVKVDEPKIAQKASTTRQSTQHSTTPIAGTNARASVGKKATSDEYGVDTETEVTPPIQPKPESVKGLLIGLFGLVLVLVLVNIGQAVALIVIVIQKRRHDNNMDAGNTVEDATKTTTHTEVVNMRARGEGRGWIFGD